MCDDFYQFYQILTAFNELKIMSDVYFLSRIKMRY
jgi:hypothetical protein